MSQDLQKFARIISNIFVPPSFNLIVFTLFAFNLENNTTKRIVVILVSLVFGFILNILLFVIFRKKGKLIDLDASIKEERTVPFLIAVLFYTAGFLVLVYFKVNIVSIAFWFCYISNTLLIILINKYWKISAHAMGAAGPTAAVFYIFPLLSIVFFLILFFVGWSRIKLKCHSLLQVIAGALLGFLSTLVQLIIITKIFQ